MVDNRDQFLVETSWLAEHLHDPDIRIVDLRGYVKIITLDASRGLQEAHYLGAREEYEQEHIPGAVYADWTCDIADPEGPPQYIGIGQCGLAQVVDGETHDGVFPLDRLDPRGPFMILMKHF